MGGPTRNVIGACCEAMEREDELQLKRCLNGTCYADFAQVLTTTVQAMKPKNLKKTSKNGSGILSKMFLQANYNM